MKYIKKFENSNNPEIGEYVLIKAVDSGRYETLYNEFINNNVGEIVSVDNKRKTIEVRYYVDTRNDFFKYKKFFRYISYDFEINEYYFSNLHYFYEILELGKTKEELILKQSTNKYNL